MKHRDSTRQVARRLAISLTLLVLLASCERAGPGSTGSTQPVETTTTHATEGPDEVDPKRDSSILSPTIELMSFGMSAAEFQNQIEREVSSCMQVRGWTYEPVLQDTAHSQPRTVGEKKLFVATYGYGQFSGPHSDITDQREVADRNHQRMMGLSPSDQEAYWVDLDGGPTTGEGQAPAGSCRGDAQGATDSILYNSAAMREMAEMSTAAYESPEYRSLRSEWAACMSEGGFDFASPVDAVFFVLSEGERLDIAEAIELEVAIATRDFECELMTVREWSYRTEVEIVRTLIDRYPEYGRDR